MGAERKIRDLAKLERTDGGFVTVYLNTRWGSEKERERVRIFVKSKLRECAQQMPEPMRQMTDGTRERIEEYVRQVVARERDEEYDGIALFACDGRGIFDVLRCHIPFRDQVACGDRPFLRQASRVLWEGERGVLVQVGAEAGRLVEFYLGGISRTWEFSDEEFPGRHEQGGWSQARFQRHVEEHLQRNLRTLAEKLAEWTDERDVARIAVAGPEEVVAAFEREVPRRLQGRLVARLRVDPHEPLPEVQAKALAALARARDEAATARLRKVLDREGDRAVGVEAVSEAVRDGRVHELFLLDSFERPGWVCPACGEMGERVPLGCPRCGAPVDAVELGEEWVRGVLASDGNVAVFREHPLLDEAGGVVAALRY
ncbi:MULTISPECIES: baeRF10 domain-containing protein [Deferrisoma]